MIHNRNRLALLTTVVALLAVSLAGMANPRGPATVQAAPQSTFSTPEEAVQSLVAAAKARDREKLRLIFGPSVKELLSGDDVQDANDLEAFVKSVAEKTELDKRDGAKIVLLIGNEKWPFAIPLTRTKERWSFDTQAGKEELLNRRIGENEEAAALISEAYVLAQWDYFANDDWDDDGVAEFAQGIVSSPGKRDGLYWSTGPDEEPSPMAPIVVYGRKEGYAAKGGGRGETAAPFLGYYYKILTGQGPSAPGGRHGYIINGNMIAGFGLVAYPATWGRSGVMTLIVNQQGRAYRKSLGPATTQIVKAMTEYNPDPTWTLVDVDE